MSVDVCIVFIEQACESHRISSQTKDCGYSVCINIDIIERDLDICQDFH